MTYNVFGGTLSLTQSINQLCFNFQTSSQNRTIQGGVRCSWQLTATNLILTLTITYTFFTILLFY